MNEPAWIEAVTLGPEAAHETWALAATQVLSGLATEYHGYITVPKLARSVMERSRIRTKAAPGNWMGDVLYRVAVQCQQDRAPLLNSLCLQATGLMGEWYADTVLTVRGDRVTDPEQHAAAERLDCYRHHGAPLPEGGGAPNIPILTPTRAARPSSAGAPKPARTARRTKAAPGRPVAAAPKVCDRCFMALTATGECNYCD